MMFSMFVHLNYYFKGKEAYRGCLQKCKKGEHL
jgi:hypothetical protein